MVRAVDSCAPFDLIARAQAGDIAARKELVERNLGLIWMIVIRQAGAARRNEFLSYGVEGFLRAVDRFDANRGVPLGAYAFHGIRGAVSKAVRRERIIAERLEFSFDQVGEDGEERQPCVDPRSQRAWLGDHADDVDRLREMIRSLPEKMAAVIQGRLSGQTFAEVGAEMGFTSSAAHKWETKARRLLRAQMSPACVVPAK